MADSRAWQVQFTASALEDLTDIIQFLLENGEADMARDLAGLLRQEGRTRLASLPFRGRVVPELETITRQYREIRIKSYRLIYRPVSEQHSVRILLIAHVKRNIRDMLLGRLLA